MQDNNFHVIAQVSLKTKETSIGNLHALKFSHQYKYSKAKDATNTSQKKQLLSVSGRTCF